MGVSGMTGFGRAEGASGGVSWVWEARSVNGRALDVKTRLPPGLEGLEPAVRELAKARFKRGSVQVGLSVRRETQTGPVSFNWPFINAVLEAGAPLIASGQVEKPRWDGILALRGAVLAEGAEETAPLLESLGPALTATLQDAFAALGAARTQEGQMLAGVLGGLLDQMEAAASLARAQAGAQPEMIAERIKARLAQLTPEAGLDPQRLAQEAALVASKADVREELERLAAHIVEARALLSAPEPAGRRLEFLAQELHREANTLGSKSADLALTRASLDLKTAIDQFKEQSANVE
jgi:uncharacterized protein (TIGR00255 family)